MSEIGLWPLDPHTRAKHALLKTYLDRWFPILGKDNQRLNYIDGFAGPGEYQGGENGSPILAIESAMEHLTRRTIRPDLIINFIFIESEKTHADHLNRLLDQMRIPEQFKVRVFEGAFRDRIGGILDKIEADKKSLAPTFAFVDPFGFSGIPLSLMTRILNYKKCEVFVNVMVDFIKRFLEHPNDSIKAHFQETFGTNDVLNIPQKPGNRLNHILELYRRQLSSHAKFVGRFDMHGRQDRKTYSLFFATNAPRGFEKMKEAMWAVDKYTGNKFSDADPNPVSLFESWGFEPLWDEMRRKFAGKTVKMADLVTFVIEQTDFLPTHAREILAKREESGEIKVETLPNCKRRGKTFPVDKVQIVFPV